MGTGTGIQQPTHQKTRTRMEGTGFCRVRVRVQLPIPAGYPCSCLDVSKEGGGIPPKDALGWKWGSGMAIWMLGTSVSPGENLGSGPMKAPLSLGLGKEEFVDIEDVREGESWGVTVRWS